jgi:hypothetical protein
MRTQLPVQIGVVSQAFDWKFGKVLASSFAKANVDRSTH